jgi:hypothetical protein
MIALLATGDNREELVRLMDAPVGNDIRTKLPSLRAGTQR